MYFGNKKNILSYKNIQKTIVLFFKRFFEVFQIIIFMIESPKNPLPKIIDRQKCLLFENEKYKTIETKKSKRNQKSNQKQLKENLSKNKFKYKTINIKY